MFMQAQLRIQTLAKEAGRAMDPLTFPQVRAMSFLAMRGASALRDIADFQGLTPSAISQVVDGLVRDGLVRRREDPRDRRRVLLDLTPEGRRAAARAQGAFVGVIARAFRSLTANERKALEQGLAALLDAYEKDPQYSGRPDQGS